MNRRFAGGPPDRAPAPARPATLRFIAALAGLGVLARVLLMDHQFFRLQRLPNHDMSEGLAFFTTSMHSVWLTGDIAWWSPLSITGYPQYFQSFFGPLAPTPGHIAFIAWTHVVGVLRTFGIHVPEYLQYLAMNYVLLPFLAFAAFGYFCAQFLRRREAVALAAAAYVLSGIGLWNSAWFYFQEPASFLFFLGATLSFVRRPDLPRVCVLLAAVVVQFASLNYWTVYNIFFAAIVLGTHAAIYRMRWLRAAKRIAQGLRARQPLLVAAAGIAGVVVILWFAFIMAAFGDQAAKQSRAVYGLADALARVPEMRRLVLGPFDPWIALPGPGREIVNSIHGAHYIGIAMLPFIVVSLLGTWDRRLRWLLASAALVLCVVTASPLAMAAWVSVPYMDRIQHVFLFYAQYWELLLVLLAAAGLDRVLDAARPVATRWIARAGLAGVAVTLATLFAVQDALPAGSTVLQAVLRAGMVLAISCLLLDRMVAGGRATELRFATQALLLLVVLDLAAYFYSANRADMAFTERRLQDVVLKPAVREPLSKPWPAPDTGYGFPAGIPRAMPFWNDFWPANTFMVPVVMTYDQSWVLARETPHGKPFLFFPDAVREAQAHVPDPIKSTLQTLDDRLRVDSPRAAGPGAPAVAAGFGYRWNAWTYNGFEIEVDAPREGWLMVRQLHEPAWRYQVDGRAVEASRANWVSTALPLAAGHHRVRADYRPSAREIYWWAAAALEIGVAMLLCIAWLASPPLNGPGRRRRPARARPLSPPPPRA